MSETKSKLTNLPVDCLEPIISMTSAYDIGNMWLIGNSKLNKSLSDGGAARKFDFTYKPQFPHQWPRLIGSLPHLVDISIRDPKESKFYSFEPDLSLLPRSIRKLSLSYKGCFSAFKRLYDVDPTRFSSLQSLHLGDSPAQADVSLDLRPLQHLTSFTASSNLLFGDIALPPYLTTLVIALCESIIISLIASLPTTLECLYLTLTAQRNIWPLLPRGLLDLHVSYTAVNMDDLQDEDLSTLPTSLISFYVHVKTFTSAMAATLPRSLKSLTLMTQERLSHHNKSEIWAQLPPNIEVVSGSLIPYDLDPDWAEKMPRNWRAHLMYPIREPELLEKLPPKTYAMTTDCDLLLLPRFTHLYRLDCRRFDLTDLKYLPASLKSFEIHTALDLSSSDIIQLPPNLQSLYLRTSKIETNAWQYLPRDLALIIFLNCFGELSPELAARQLPPNLTSLEVTELETTFGFLQNLPVSLESLQILARTEKRIQFTPKLMQEIGTKEKIEEDREVEQMEQIKGGQIEEKEKRPLWSHALPRFTKLSSLVIRANGSEFVGTRYLLQTLPRRLTSLDIAATKTDVTNSDLQQFLPHGLGRLYIVSSPNVTLSLGSALHSRCKLMEY